MNKPFLTGLKGLFLTSLITTQSMAKAPASVPGMSSKRSTIWTGRAISMLVVLALLTDAVVNLLAPERVANEVIATGFKISQTPALGTIVLFCALLYAIPRTAVLGAILVTGFLGGAICTHFRLGDVFSPPQIVGLVLGALTWAGIYLRDARLRALLPVTVGCSRQRGEERASSSGRGKLLHP